MHFLNWAMGLITQIVGWLIRPRNLGTALISRSSAVLISLGAGFSIKAKGIAGVVDTFEFSTADGLTGTIFTIVAYMAVVTWVTGLLMVVWTYWRESKAADARRVVVVELRGLVDTSDRPLLGSMPRSFGQPLDCLVNVRQMLGAKPPQVEEALRDIGDIQRRVRLARGDSSRANVKVVAGGVMQVPLQFYVGTLLDDEGEVTLYDWERTEKKWKALSEADDGSRFAITGLDTVHLADEVVLAVSASYAASMGDIAATFPVLPVVHMARPNPLPNALWSEVNQAALTQQFLQTLAGLQNRGVKTVHLVLAAPASLCIRFGMAYDQRNMPQLRCYQWESGQVPPYAWSVQMPQSGQPAAYLTTPALIPSPLAA